MATAERAVERAREANSPRVLEIARRHLSMFQRRVPYVMERTDPGEAPRR